ncbi:MAG: glycosyltransferase family 4 protein [Anaeromyxobacter sp.]|nr:glycosyltransferase family 4 protein [Anaeromyxobacter sp.]
MRVAALLSHPVQYHSPYFRLLSQALPGFRVFYCARHGLEPSYDRGFGQVIQYDVPLLEGYDHEFLPNWSTRPGPSFWGLVNPSAPARLGEGGYDAVIVYSYAAVTQLLTIAGPRPGGLKVLLRGDSNLLPRRGAVTSLAKQALLRPLFRRVDHFLAAGTANVSYYREFGVPLEKITVAPFAVDDQRFTQGAKEGERHRDTTRRTWGLPATGPIFVFCGKLAPHKRAVDAVRAVAQLPPEAPWGLVMVGTGVEEPAIRAEIDRLGLQARVKLVGFVNQAALPALYSACDALVLPSASDAWGLVVNEAMACGLAVASSAHVGAAQDLVKGNGFVFPVGGVEALAAGLRDWLEQPARLAAAKLESRRLIAQWSIQHSVEATVRALALVTGKPA